MSNDLPRKMQLTKLGESQQSHVSLRPVDNSRINCIDSGRLEDRNLFGGEQDRDTLIEQLPNYSNRAVT